MNNRWKTYAGWIALSEGVGALAGLLTREGVRWYSQYAKKPALTPPPAAFPIAWGILYALMGAGAARIAMGPPSEERTAALRTFYFQLGANFLWSILFFNLRAYGAAFLLLAILWALIVWMTLSFARLDRIAGALQIPYLLWVLFAGYLNLGVWLLNR